ncbi:hypothetical protein [Micromonospora costi]|nr:hypothetical protein [Micromonospora costi]
MSDSDGHVWRTRSRHRTSEGIVYYQCCHCGLWRIHAGRVSGSPAGVLPLSARRPRR